MSFPRLDPPRRREEIQEQPWPLSTRLDIARRHLMKAARQADVQGEREKHKLILAAVSDIDDAEEAE